MLPFVVEPKGHKDDSFMFNMSFQAFEFGHQYHLNSVQYNSEVTLDHDDDVEVVASVTGVIKTDVLLVLYRLLLVAIICTQKGQDE